MSRRRPITVTGLLVGNLAPIGLAVAVLLGALAGFWAGWNLSFALLVALALVLNINVRLFALSTVTAAAVAWLAAPLSHDLGQWMLDEHHLGEAVAAYTGGPVGALMAWDVYALVGGTPIGLGLGVVAVAILVKLTPPESTRRCRLVAWLGANANEADAANDDATFDNRRLRPYGIIIPVVVLPCWLAVTAAVVPQVVRQAIVDELTEQNGATVSIGRWEYRLWSGELRADDVRFADPAQPDTDRLRIDCAAGQLDAAAVLRGELHLQQLRLAGLSANRRRLEPAEVSAVAMASSDAPIEKPRQKDATPARANTADDTLTVDVATAYAHWDAVAGFTGRYRTLCEVLMRSASQHAAPPNALGDYVALARSGDDPRRCELRRVAAHSPAQRLEIVGLPESWRLGDDASVTWQCGPCDVESRERIARLWLTAPARWSCSLATEINVADPAARRPVRLSLRGVPAEYLADWNSGGVNIAATGGSVDVRAEGWLDADRLDVSLRATGEELSLSADTLPAVRRPTGADTIRLDVLADAVAKTRRLGVDARVAGPWQRPRLTITPDRLLADVDYESLLGARQLARQQSTSPSSDAKTGFRAPQSQPPKVAMRTPGGPKAAQPDMTGWTPTSSGPRVGQMAPAVGVQGLRVEVAKSLGVSVSGPTRIYVETPRRAEITVAENAVTPPAAAADPTTSGALPAESAAQQQEDLQRQQTAQQNVAVPRELSPPTWLKTGYDLSPQSTAAGRRWAAQRDKDRQRAEQVLTQRTGVDDQR